MQNPPKSPVLRRIFLAMGLIWLVGLELTVEILEEE
jgi:hypothetical protein